MLLPYSFNTNLKAQNKKCGKEDFRLVQESVKSEVTTEIFEERLDALIESHSVNIKLLGTRTCLSLPKLNQDNNGKEISDEALANNNTLAISEKEELIKFEKSIIEEFDALKSSSFAEVNSFKNKHLNSYPNDVFVNNSERLIKQLQDTHLLFLLDNAGWIVSEILEIFLM